MHKPFKDRLAAAIEESQRQKTDRYLRETPWWVRVLERFAVGIGAVAVLLIPLALNLVVSGLLVGVAWWLLSLAFPALPSLSFGQFVAIAAAFSLLRFLFPSNR